MSWIRTIGYNGASGRLRKLYDRIKGPDNNVDNIMLAHSLRPHSLEGHMTLYKHVLHNSANTLEPWYLETIGIYVSVLNDCRYCVEHHVAGLARMLTDARRAADIRRALEERRPGPVFSDKELAGLEYAEKLTREPTAITPLDIENLRQSGFDDGEILEINQVTAYFGYANRTVLGLGISTDGDILGLSPRNSDNTEDWTHS